MLDICKPLYKNLIKTRRNEKKNIHCQLSRQAHLIHEQIFNLVSKHISLSSSPEILFIIRNCCFEKTARKFPPTKLKHEDNDTLTLLVFLNGDSLRYANERALRDDLRSGWLSQWRLRFLLLNDDEMTVTIMSVQYRQWTHRTTQMGLPFCHVEIPRSVFILACNMDAGIMTAWLHLNSPGKKMENVLQVCNLSKNYN